VADELEPVDALEQISFLVQGTLERRAGEHDSSLIQMRLLGILRDRKPTMSELGLLLGLDRSSTSGLVDRAARRGLVRRLPSQIDRRSVRVSLTAEGRTLIQGITADFDADIAAILEPLDPEARVTIAALLGRVIAAQSAERGVENRAAAVHWR
jgi:DNA-binding MarR family transcriptional regulator